MPQITLRTTVDGREDAISEYICDWPGCPHPAVQVVAVIPSLRMRAAACAEHAAQMRHQRDGDGRR